MKTCSPISYYTSQKKYRQCYSEMRWRIRSDKDRSEYIQDKSFLQGFTRHTRQTKSGIEAKQGDIRIDVPVWFGRPNKHPIVVVGMMPRATDDRFNLITTKISKRKRNIYAAIFGADHWNETSSLHPQMKYYCAFRPLIDMARKGNAFLVFTDFLKNYPVKFKKNARGKLMPDGDGDYKYFCGCVANKKSNIFINDFRKELSHISPDTIIAVGREVQKVVKDLKLSDVCVYPILHPACRTSMACRKAFAEINEIIMVIKRRQVQTPKDIKRRKQ